MTQPSDLNRTIEALLDSYAKPTGGMEHVNSYELPNMEDVGRCLEMLRTLLYPGFVGRGLIRATPTELHDHIREKVTTLEGVLRRQLYRGLHHQVQIEKGTAELDCPNCAEKASVIANDFIAYLPALRDELAMDVEAHFKGDPAATGTDEIIFCYPGLYAITVYRIANKLLRMGTRLIPRMMASLAHEKVGIDIHPGATIGESFFIDHGTGVVIGETAVIGPRVKIYQGVTLGALSVKKREGTGEKRHPTIGKDVVIYAGATILGGDTVIGDGSVIGGNSWVTESVAPGSLVTIHRKEMVGA